MAFINNQLNNNINNQMNHTASNKLDHHYLDMKFDNITTQYDSTYHALWCILKTSQTPVLSIPLLNDIRHLQDNVAQHCKSNPKSQPKYMIWLSDSSCIFNLGIDLEYILQLIIEKDVQRLTHYIQLCIDAYYINLAHLDINPLITMSLISGRAYGGGLDTALACDIVVAENHAKCRFPEINYNILPSIGTIDMLLRQYPISVIEELLFEGKNLNLDTLIKMSVVDNKVEKGCGVDFIKERIKQLDKHHVIYAEMFKRKRANVVITYAELEAFKNTWLQTALDMNPEYIRKLHRVIQAQNRFTKRMRN